jgi:hypothetical protein
MLSRCTLDAPKFLGSSVRVAFRGLVCQTLQGSGDLVMFRYSGRGEDEDKEVSSWGLDGRQCPSLR